MRQHKRCSHRGCCAAAPHAIGWGFATKHLEWFCLRHFAEELARTARLLRLGGLFLA